MYLTIIAAALLVVYPKTPAWTTAYGDTAVVLGAHAGVFSGCHALGGPIQPPQSLANAGLRVLVGCALILFLRTLLRKLGLGAGKGYSKEIPGKFVQYWILGFFAAFIVPLTVG
jgi:hypothetical protein